MAAMGTATASGFAGSSAAGLTANAFPLAGMPVSGVIKGMADGLAANEQAMTGQSMAAMGMVQRFHGSRAASRTRSSQFWNDHPPPLPKQPCAGPSLSCAALAGGADARERVHEPCSTLQVRAGLEARPRATIGAFSERERTRPHLRSGQYYYSDEPLAWQVPSPSPCTHRISPTTSAPAAPMPIAARHGSRPRPQTREHS